MHIKSDALTDLRACNKTTGLEVYSIGTVGGAQSSTKQAVAAPGWTSIVPLKINGDLLTDLLSYNAASGRAVYSVAAAN